MIISRIAFLVASTMNKENLLATKNHRETKAQRDESPEEIFKALGLKTPLDMESLWK